MLGSRKEMADYYRKIQREQGHVIACEIWKKVKATMKTMVTEINEILYATKKVN